MADLLTAVRNPLGLKQIREDGCLSYLLWDRASLEGVVIDPTTAGREEIREFSLSHGVRLVSILETHTHADHLSSSHAFRRETGARIVMGRKTTSVRADRLVSTGDEICFGKLKLQVLETPGHTPDSVCFSYHSEGPEESLLFTGDTLFLGSTGRTDFPGADAAALFDSLRLIEAQKTPATCIFPGHDYSDLLFSLLGVEQKKNSQFSQSIKEEFVRQKNEESLLTDKSMISTIVEYNLAAEPGAFKNSGGSTAAACGSAVQLAERVPAIQVQKYVAKLKSRASGELFIDVREREEFSAGHIPGLENIPLSELALSWKKLNGAKKVYLSCQSGRRSQMAAQTLDRIGITGIVNVSGGFQAWVSAGYPVEKSPS